MTTNYIYKQVRKVSFINLIIPVILCFLLVIFFMHIPYKDILSPRILNSADMIDSYYKSNKRIVEITFDKLYYTGYDSVKNDDVAGYYYYTLNDNTCTFVLVDADNLSQPKDMITNYTMKASIQKQNSLVTNMISDFSSDLSWTKDGLLSMTSSCYIDETGFNESLYLFLGICLFILTVLLLSYLFINAFYIAFPGLCPACQHFKNLCSDNASINDVNYELINNIRLTAGHITITEHYLIVLTTFYLVFIPLDKIKSINTHFSFYKTRKHEHQLIYNLTLHCDKKIKCSIPYIAEDYVDVITEYLKEYFPDINITKHGKHFR